MSIGRHPSRATLFLFGCCVIASLSTMVVLRLKQFTPSTIQKPNASMPLLIQKQ